MVILHDWALQLTISIGKRKLMDAVCPSMGIRCTLRDEVRLSIQFLQDKWISQLVFYD